MIDIQQNNWQKFTAVVQRNLATVNFNPNSKLHPQMPDFQIKLFIQQAFQKNKTITIWLQDAVGNEHAVTGKLRSSLHRPQTFLLVDQNAIPTLVTFKNIKFLKLI
ncbi:hypothetical protein [Liquorilactobacillus sicerae]|uniref:hypothetical protein n=1 Tax=Liquorilactobacillus sicerae TaxID=1416943 RepID=UPI0024804482|nr:hypothetical protein [Liquorilactobacillus sicerae]